MMHSAYILLGTNLGDRKMNLTMASNLIANSVGTILQRSEIYESDAWGKEDQPDFLNQVIHINTSLNPSALLQKLAWIEASLGRLREVRWGERIIDLDILFYENEVVNSKALTIPHPGIPVRRFTLLPLSEIAPKMVHPVLKKTMEELLAECSDKLNAWIYRE